MRHWAIRESNVAGSTLRLISRQRVSIKKGDHAVTFSPKRGAIEFTATANVRAVDSVRKPDGRTAFTAHLGHLQPIENPPKLIDLAYSLLRVYRYDRPDLHFRRTYVSLTFDDFETIATSRVFWARTAFGLFMNQLSPSARAYVLSSLALADPDPRSRFGIAWNKLSEFIEREYGAAATLFSSIAEIANKLERSIPGFKYQNIRLSSDIPQVSDALSVQERRFAAFADLFFVEGRHTILDDIQKEIDSAAESENTFEQLFEGTPWPLTRRY